MNYFWKKLDLRFWKITLIELFLFFLALKKIRVCKSHGFKSNWCFKNSLFCKYLLVIELKCFILKRFERALHNWKKVLIGRFGQNLSPLTCWLRICDTYNKVLSDLSNKVSLRLFLQPGFVTVHRNVLTNLLSIKATLYTLLDTLTEKKFLKTQPFVHLSNHMFWSQ